MKQIIASCFLAVPLLTGAVLAQTASPGATGAAGNSQQDKMKACNAQASGKTGDARKTFMKECLSSKPAAGNTQQQKMKDCNAQAAGKKGDERKAFMKQCLSA